MTRLQGQGTSYALMYMVCMCVCMCVCVLAKQQRTYQIDVYNERAERCNIINQDVSTRESSLADEDPRVIILHLCCVKCFFVPV